MTFTSFQVVNSIRRSTRGEILRSDDPMSPFDPNIPGTLLPISVKTKTEIVEERPMENLAQYHLPFHRHRLVKIPATRRPVHKQPIRQTMNDRKPFTIISPKRVRKVDRKRSDTIRRKNDPKNRNRIVDTGKRRKVVGKSINHRRKK